MQYKIRNTNLYLFAERKPQDCQKAILPTAIFVNTNHSSFAELRQKGFFIYVGWWDFSIRFGMVFLNK